MSASYRRKRLRVSQLHSTFSQRHGQNRPKVIYSSLLAIHGGVAQWLEQSAHNRLVAGSSPAAPTIISVFKSLPKKGQDKYCGIEDISGE